MASIKLLSNALANIRDSRFLKPLFDAVRTELGANRTLANELRTDHAGFRTAMSTSKTLTDELRTDHGAFITAVDTSKTLTDELREDHAGFKTAVDGGKALVDEMYDDEEAKRNVMDFSLADGVRWGDYTFAEQADPTILGAGTVVWERGGIKHYASIAGNIALAAPSTTTIANGKYGAWRVVISDAGAVTTQAANATTMQFDSAEEALLNLAAIAPTANTVTIGYLTLLNTSGAADFTIGTTNTDTTTTTVMYYERAPRKQATGLTAALGVASSVGTTPEQYATGTKDVQINGVGISQIAAEATKAFDDNDTIAQDKFGGWLVVTNLAQSATYSLAANGIAGTLSAMDYDTAALAEADVGEITNNLPSMFCPVSRVIVENELAGIWTANTDDIAGTDGTPTFTDATVGTWERVSASGFDSHKLAPPSIPDALTATKASAGPATITAPVATAGPATITAAAATAGPGAITASELSESLEE